MSTVSFVDTSSNGDAAISIRVLVAGEQVGRYVVRRLLGQGGMGQVYLARDTVLGRSVALKLVGSRVDGFLQEARAIAALNHPNIIQLYDFGEHAGGMYLALEHVEGETLRERMARGAVGTDEALRHLRAIADALGHAHTEGVIHCDLKPSNVMFGADGRLRVVDFGIARTATDRFSVGGTPDWMAPEQREPGAVTPAVDIWALGLLATQLLTGRNHLELDATSVPGTVARLITRSLHLDPAQRPTATRWSTMLSAEIEGKSMPVLGEGPFPGLAAFDEGHAAYYFGREAALDEIVERLRAVALLPIVGPSGVGKSSFLLAGVIPRLKARESWRVLLLRPGGDPVGALARQIALLTEPPDAVRDHARVLRAELLETPTLLASRLATIAAAERCHILVAIDQFEEVFTQCEDVTTRVRFLEMLRAATDDAEDPIRVVFTVRDDFAGQLVGVRSLFVLQRMTSHDLRSTLTGPLTRAGYTADDDALIDDLVTNATTLPMLQFACRALWERRDPDSRTIRRATYEEIGGVAGAFATHAQRAVEELPADDRRVARALLLRLVDGRTRRAEPRATLVTKTHDSLRAEVVLDRLLAARLVVQRTSDDEGTPLVEIAHDSLLVSWHQLARWIAESHDERRLLDELESATSVWERRGRRPEESWPIAEVATIRQRVTQLDLQLPDRLESFLASGEQRYRQRRRRRAWTVGIALAAVVAIVVPTTLMFERYLGRERLIRDNAGTVDLVIRAYDWRDGGVRPAALDELPGLTWSLHAATDANTPGPLLDGTARISQTRHDNTLDVRLRAPGGRAFLAIDGRGAHGEHCTTSWIRIEAFPGYAAGATTRIEVEVPTCQASAADTIDVPAGPFIYGGEGEPASKVRDQRDYTGPEATVDLPAFAMDRLEISNATFAPFARLTRITGYVPPHYGSDSVHGHDADPMSPITAITSQQAAAFCAFLGKSLPTDEEWVKAARGGLVIDGKPNPMPRRTYPWGAARSPTCVNEAGTQDGYAWVAPVDSFACGAGPYGHLNLVGNVNEWTATSSDGFNVIRGGSVGSPPELEQTTTSFINQRNPATFDYSLGARCVTRKGNN